MVSRILVRKMLRDLFARKLALAALLAIVAVGVGSFTAMRALHRDLDGARARYYGDYRLFDFVVDLKRAPAWAAARAAHLPNVRRLRGRVDIAVRIDLEGVHEPVAGRAISMPSGRAPVINDLLLRSGAWFSHDEAKEAILDDAFARANRLGPGDRIRVLLLDKQHDLLVVGTAMSPEFVYLIPPGGGFAPDPQRYGVLYAPERFLQKSCDLDGAFNQLVGLAHDAAPRAVADTLSLLEEELDAFGVTNTTSAADTASVRFLSDELEGLRIQGAIMPAIFLGVAALVLNVLMSRLVIQQRTVIGTLKAVGYSSGAMLRHYLGYGVALGALGGALGIGLGYVIQSLMVGLYRRFFALPAIDAHLHADIMLGGVGISVLFACAGTLKGVRRASKLAPAEAMRPPPPERGGAVLPERIGFLWRRLPFRWKMILRDVFRNPFRTTVGIVAGTIATSLIVSTLGMVDSLDYIMNYTFDKVAHQDVTVSLRDPEGRRSASELRDLPTIREAEPQLSVACDVANGPFRKRIGVTGLPPGNRLFTPLDGADQPIVVADEGLVLSKKLAEMLNVRAGDQVRLRPLIGRRQEVVAPVVAITETFLGMSAYADIGYLSRLLGEDRSANTLFATRQGGSSYDELLRELKKRPSVVAVGQRRRAFEQMNETFGEHMGVMISIMVLFGGLIAFGSVLNAALVQLSERQRDVGTLRVLGYTPRQISKLFAGESHLINAVGVLLGLAGGIGLLHLLTLAYDTELYRFPTVVYPSRLIQSALLMVAFVAAAQWITYRLVRRLDWLEVLKIKE